MWYDEEETEAYEGSFPRLGSHVGSPSVWQQEHFRWMSLGTTYCPRDQNKGSWQEAADDVNKAPAKEEHRSSGLLLLTPNPRLHFLMYAAIGQGKKFIVSL